MSNLTPDQSARLIFEKGPLTRSELKKLPQDRTYEYFQLMSSFLEELGETAFTARREEIREAVLRKIVNRPA